MSGPVFVRDAQGRPLMSISAAHARKLVQHGKAAFIPHHAFTILQLAQVIEAPSLRPVILGIAVHRTTAELTLIAEGTKKVFPLLHIVIDLTTDLPRRLRRRAEHRRRRRLRGRYRQPAHYGVPFKLRRPNMQRSSWGCQLRRAKKASGHSDHRTQRINPTVRWRVEAVERVIANLQLLIPISHVVILSPLCTTGPEFADLRPSERRQHLINRYGVQDEAGALRAACCYCGTREGTIEVDHIVPQSAGGSNHHHNLTLACARCNARKGDRTPVEANMVLSMPTPILGAQSEYIHPMVRHTARVLYGRLSAIFQQVAWKRSSDDALPMLSPLTQAALTPGSGSFKPKAAYIAKPIARTRKQAYTGRNYPLSTPLTPSFTQLGHTVKRRVRVNRGLVLWPQARRSRVQVIAEGDAFPSGNNISIERGMFCEAQRAGEIVQGIVGAIHSSGRLTLLVPEHISVQGIKWKKVVVSPQSHCRLLSTNKVIFIPIGS